LASSIGLVSSNGLASTIDSTFINNNDNLPDYESYCAQHTNLSTTHLMNDRHTPLVKLLHYTSNEKPSFTTLSNASVLNQKTSNDENEQCAASILIDDPEPRFILPKVGNSCLFSKQSKSPIVYSTRSKITHLK